jgi:hypothetical protein
MAGEDEQLREYLEKNAASDLLPSYYINAASLLTCFICKMVYVFFSPHRKCSSAYVTALDRKLGSFFFLSFAGSLLVAATQTFTVCAVHSTNYDIGHALMLMTSVGFCVQGTNLLCHRYLLQRAVIMMDEIFKETNPSGGCCLSVQSLQTSFIWELRLIVLAGSTIVVYFINERVSFIMGAITTFFIMLADTVFSVVVTSMFIKPLQKVLKLTEGNIDASRSKGLQRTKWLNLLGVVVSVGSSTLLYCNIIVILTMTFNREYYLLASPFGNPWVFGISMDSILNNVGMIVLCGILKHTGGCFGVSTNGRRHRPPRLLRRRSTVSVFKGVGIGVPRIMNDLLSNAHVAPNTALNEDGEVVISN